MMKATSRRSEKVKLSLRRQGEEEERKQSLGRLTREPGGGKGSEAKKLRSSRCERYEKSCCLVWFVQF